MKTKTNSKKWQKLISRWHEPQLQEGLGFLFDDMQLHKRTMSLRQRTVVSSIIKFAEKLYSNGYDDNLNEYLYKEFVSELTKNQSKNLLDSNLKLATFINEIKGKLPEEFYWKDDDRKLSVNRAEKLIRFLEKARDTNSEEYKVLEKATFGDSIDETIQKKSGERDWESKYIKEFHFKC